MLLQHFRQSISHIGCNYSFVFFNLMRKSNCKIRFLLAILYLQFLICHYIISCIILADKSKTEYKREHKRVRVGENLAAVYVYCDEKKPVKTYTCISLELLYSCILELAVD